MSVKLRLTRNGSRGKPFYWLIAADSKSPRDGAFLEKLGTYNPMVSGEVGNKLNFKADKIQKWLSCGAVPTERVEKLLEQASIELPKKIKLAKTRREASRKSKPVVEEVAQANDSSDAASA